MPASSMEAEASVRVSPLDDLQRSRIHDVNRRTIVRCDNGQISGSSSDDNVTVPTINRTRRRESARSSNNGFKLLLLTL